MTRSKQRFPRRGARRALSLVEVLIAGAIVAGLLAAAAVAYEATVNSIQVNDRFNRAAQTARVGIRRMVEEVRTSDACQVGTNVQQAQASIVGAPNLDVVRADGNVVHYVYNSAAKEVRLTVDQPTPRTVVMARDVTSARFTADVAAHPQTGVRRTVRVVIEMTLTVEGEPLYLTGSAVPRREMVY